MWTLVALIAVLLFNLASAAVSDPFKNAPDLSDDLQDLISRGEDGLTCHGVSGDYWVMSRDVAMNNVKEFCGHNVPTRIFNGGTVNELVLSIKKLGNPALGPSSSPDCVGRFQRAIDGCDGNNQLNPHNYKFGSTMISPDGWMYSLKPLSKQVNQVVCDVQYKFFWDTFEIRGKNWKYSELGVDGEKLRHELSGCGALNLWEFERTPNDCCFEWYAKGNLPIGTKGCIGRALETTGGSNKGSCQGPGKRDLAGLNSIVSWPGYGDESKHIFRNTSNADEKLQGSTFQGGDKDGQNRRMVQW